MSTLVAVNTYTHTVTYVTDQLLRSLKRILVAAGLEPADVLVEAWSSYDRAISTWLRSKDLTSLVLEVYSPQGGGLISRWDISIDYTYGSGDDGSMWFDPDTISQAIAKAGVPAGKCSYRIIAFTKPGRPDVEGWGPAEALRSTDGFVKQSVGTAIGTTSIGAGLEYWRRK